MRTENVTVPAHGRTHCREDDESAKNRSRCAYMQARDVAEEMLEEHGVELPTMRSEIEAPFDTLRDARDGAGGDIVRYLGVRTEMLLIDGSTSWDKDIEACSPSNLF
ncbi:MAG: hypothetical protein U0359_00265 [Byssovorax sp.]